MLYKYREQKPYRYYDVVIAEVNDILEIKDERIINRQRGVDLSNGMLGVIQDIKSKCEPYVDPNAKVPEAPPQDVDLDAIDDDISGMKILKVDNQVYYNLYKLGLLDSSVRDHNEGLSNYSKYTIQPWAIWQDYNLNPWDADIVKRVLRTKEEPGMSETESRILDYKKIIHICQERIRQLGIY